MSLLFDFYMILAFRAWSRSQLDVADTYMRLAWECIPNPYDLDFNQGA